MCLSFCEQHYTVIHNIFGINCSIRDKETLDHINFTDKNGLSL